MAQSSTERSRQRRARTKLGRLLLPRYEVSPELRAWLVKKEWVLPEDRDNPEMVAKGIDEFQNSLMGGASQKEGGRSVSRTFRIAPIPRLSVRPETL